MGRPLAPTSAAVVLLLSTSACSLVFDGDDFLFADASVPDARVVPDVDPSGIALMSIEPSFIDEGSGCVPDGEGSCGEGSRPVPVVLTGVNITRGATVTLSGGGFDGEVDAVVSDAGDRIAFAISAPVRPDLAAGAEEMITVTVTQDGFEAEQMLALRGLDELSLPAACEGEPPACDAGALSGRYSRVEITADFRATGDEPLVLRATSEIVLGGVITADGSAPVSTDAGGVPGPGGCAGGPHGVSASCGDGSGGGSGPDGGGGGGGNGTAGTAGGGGEAGGDGGAAAGPDTLTPLALSGGRGGGGGGPASGLLGSSNGGAGGGGGGVVVLRTGGRLHVTAGGGVSAAGGDGQPGSNAGCGTLGNGYTGGGGGGSGGAIFLGATLALVDDGEGIERLRAPGGAAGPGPGSCLAGGSGGDGLVRIDAPIDADLPGIAQSIPEAYRGPVLAPTLPAIATEARLEVELYGAVGGTYYLQVGTAEPAAVQTGAGHRASDEVELEPGVNRVCAKVDADASPANQEGLQCHTVVYVPRSSS